MSDLSLGDINFSSKGTNLFIDDAPFDPINNFMLWVDATLVQNRDIIGVIGVGGHNGPGVWGQSGGDGVVAQGNFGVRAAGSDVGVYGRGGGFAGLVGEARNDAVGVWGQADQNHAVVCDNRLFTTPPGPNPKSTAGCLGVTHDGFATVGVIKFDPNRKPSSGNAALLGIVEFDPKRGFGDPVTALLAQAAVGQSGTTPKFYQGYAGIFNGPVVINGPLTVSGKKSAAVPHPDGSHRRLYCLETPDSLFEDVGRGQLRQGAVEIRLDPDFAVLIHTEDYHVFLTAEGDCGGLYVAARHPDRFSVREHGGGRSGAWFSYRIVSKRKDIAAPRLETVRLPQPEPPIIVVPEARTVKMPPPLTRPAATSPAKRRSPKKGSGKRGERRR